MRGVWQARFPTRGRGGPVLVALAAFQACLAVDEVQTPNADVDLSSERGAGGGGGSSASGDSPAASGSCAEPGWALVRVGGRDQLIAWTAPVLTPSCSAAPHRLTALAPRLGSSVSLDVSSSTGQVVEATYSSTSSGADGELWGEYVAPIDIATVRFGTATSAEAQPFEFAGAVLGPFGPVSIAMSGCALIRPTRC
jgi:hypothetical protein